jgi:DnaK suppressor protein
MRDDTDMEYYRNRLKKRRAALLESKKAGKSDGPVELDQARVGRLSRMDAMQQQAMAQAAANLSNHELTGEYGYCVLCDEEMAESRLRFDPSVLICIACVRKAEAK